MLIFRKIHRFYLNFALFLAILLGFIWASVANLAFFVSISWLILAIFLALFAFIFARNYTLILIILAGFLLAFWRFSNFRIEQNSFEKIIGAQTEIQGRLIEDGDCDAESGNCSLKIAVLRAGKTNLRGKIWARVKNNAEFRRSDEIILQGKLSDGFGGFGAAVYRPEIRKIIRHPEMMRDFRNWFASGISKYIASPQLELGLGYLLGQKNSLPSALETALRVTALTHIVVASGYNLTILVNFARQIFGKISKKISILTSVALVISFVLIVGFSPSMTRAGIVALLGILFWSFGRKPNPYFLLIFVAAAMLLINPENLFDLGWQLSFGSFFGVMILAPLLQNFFFEKPKKLNSIAGIFFETFSAQIATLPLVVYTFGAFSPLSIVANMLVLPLIPLAMLLTFLTGVFAHLFAPIAQIFGFLAEMVLRFSVEIIQFLGAQEGARLEMKIESYQVWIFYAILALAVGFLHFRNRISKGDSASKGFFIS
ncbi:MAG: ComEC/Rec2 family competence protein [bacterium]|nr:ComEC/Rec2 family competence protein [bacterium]